MKDPVATELVHRGVDYRRTKDGSYSGNREAVFAAEWEAAQNPPQFLNGGIGTLDWLLAMRNVERNDGFGRYATTERFREVTQIEAAAAATVIQWLGTSCGFSWLEETLKKAGFVVIEKERFEARKAGR